MNKIFLLAALLICFLSSCSQSHSQGDYWNRLPSPKGWVNDFEDIYTDGQKHILDSLIRSYNSKADVQFAVITIDSKNISRDHFDSLVYKIGNAWGIGEKGKNNGIVIGISKSYRYMRIENGLGIWNRISEQQTSGFIQKSFIPDFKKDNYFDGTVNGLNAIYQYLLQEKQPK